MVALALGSDKSPGCSGEGRCVRPGTHSQPAYGHLPMVMEMSLGARGVPGGHGLGARRARYSVLRFSGGRLRCPQTQGSLGILEGRDRVPLPPAPSRAKGGTTLIGNSLITVSCVGTALHSIQSTFFLGPH